MTHGDWEIDEGAFGGHVVRHRHGDVTAVAYLYSNPDRAWAECTMCQAELELILAEHEAASETR